MRNLRITYIGFFFFLLSLIGLPMFYLDLIILDTIKYQVTFVHKFYESHPFIFTISIVLISLISLTCHVLLRAKKRKKPSIILCLFLFLFLAAFANTLVYEIFRSGFPNQANELEESFSMYWLYYFEKSIHVSMWFFPLLGFMLDKLFAMRLKPIEKIVG